MHRTINTCTHSKSLSVNTNNIQSASSVRTHTRSLYLVCNHSGRLEHLTNTRTQSDKGQQHCPLGSLGSVDCPFRHSPGQRTRGVRGGELGRGERTWPGHCWRDLFNSRGSNVLLLSWHVLAEAAHRAVPISSGAAACPTGEDHTCNYAARSVTGTDATVTAAAVALLHS